MLVTIRNFAFEGVSTIHKDYYKHLLRTSEFIAKLAKLESKVRYGSGSGARLLADLQVIQEYSNALADEVVALFDRCQALFESFSDRVEDAIKDLVSKKLFLRRLLVARLAFFKKKKYHSKQLLFYATLIDKFCLRGLFSIEIKLKNLF